MFTGIVEEMGIVKNIQRGIKSIKLTLQAWQILEDVKLGDSIAVNGVCLTVVNFTQRAFVVDVMPETLAKTNLGALKSGDKVNLERALAAGTRLGGHMVSGHVDGVGIVKQKQRLDNAIVVEITAGPEVMKYIVNKGSVAIDGVSLTVVDRTVSGFRVSLIPHTAAVTTLGLRKPGDQVNLEADVIGKYVERYLEQKQTSSQSRINEAFLAEHGFLEI